MAQLPLKHRQWLWCSRLLNKFGLQCYTYNAQNIVNAPSHQLGWGLRCNISEGNAAWYRVGVNRWPIGNHPSFMLYRLGTFDTAWLKSQKLLWPRTLGHLCPSPVLVTVPCTFLQCPRGERGTTKKWGGCAPTFEMLPAPLLLWRSAKQMWRHRRPGLLISQYMVLLPTV